MHIISWYKDHIYDCVFIITLFVLNYLSFGLCNVALLFYIKILIHCYIHRRTKVFNKFVHHILHFVFTIVTFKSLTYHQLR